MTASAEYLAAKAMQHAEEAAAVGLELIGPGRNANRRTYRWAACGHVAEYETSNVRDGRARCQQCIDQRLIEEAAAVGLALIGPGRNAQHRTYRWTACGHSAGYQTGNVRDGHVLCRTCNDTSRTKPGYIYLLRIECDGAGWLKLGYAKRVDTRTKGYGLPSHATIEVLRSVPYSTGEEAHRVEASIHGRLAKYRISSEIMACYHRRGGYSECYPVTVKPLIVAMLDAADHQTTRRAA